MKSLSKPLIVLCVLTVFAVGPTKSDAGIIPWVYDAIFGPNRAPSYGGYGGYYRAPAYSYYAPTYSYAPVVSPGPCGWQARYVPCAPCATPCAPCSVSSTSAKQPTVAEADGQKTFADEDKTSKGFEAKNDGTDNVSAPDGFEPPKKTDDDNLGQEQEVKKQSTDDADAAKKDEGDKKDDSDTANSSSAKTNVKKEVAPTDVKIDEKANSKDDKKTDDADKSKGDGAAKSNGPVDLEQKITWRVAPKRTRLALKANVGAPTVARRKVKVNADWVATESDTRVASK